MSSSTFLTALTIVLSLSSSSVIAQAPASASPAQLAIVDAQYVNSGLASSSNTGFGVPLKSTALLTVTYPFGIVQNGAAYTVDQVKTGPEIAVTPSNSTASTYGSSAKYTLMLADAASLGDPDKQGNYRHFLSNGLTGAAPSSGNLTFEPMDGKVITSYAAPGPLPGTGPHRYAWLLFLQSSSFTAPANLSAAGTAPSHWNVSSYVQSTGLTLEAASFFTVQNGNPTASVVSTSAVNTAAVTSSAAAGGGSTSSGQKTGSSAAASPTQPSSGAFAIRLSKISCGALAFLASIMML